MPASPRASMGKLHGKLVKLGKKVAKKLRRNPKYNVVLHVSSPIDDDFANYRSSSSCSSSTESPSQPSLRVSPLNILTFPSSHFLSPEDALLPDPSNINDPIPPSPQLPYLKPSIINQTVPSSSDNYDGFPLVRSPRMILKPSVVNKPASSSSDDHIGYPMVRSPRMLLKPIKPVKHVHFAPTISPRQIKLQDLSKSPALSQSTSTPQEAGSSPLAPSPILDIEPATQTAAVPSPSSNQFLPLNPVEELQRSLRSSRLQVNTTTDQLNVLKERVTYLQAEIHSLDFEHSILASKLNIEKIQKDAWKNECTKNKEEIGALEEHLMQAYTFIEAMVALDLHLPVFSKVVADLKSGAYAEKVLVESLKCALSDPTCVWSRVISAAVGAHSPEDYRRGEDLTPNSKRCFKEYEKEKRFLDSKKATISSPNTTAITLCAPTLGAIAEEDETEEEAVPLDPQLTCQDPKTDGSPGIMHACVETTPILSVFDMDLPSIPSLPGSPYPEDANIEGMRAPTLSSQSAIRPALRTLDTNLPDVNVDCKNTGELDEKMHLLDINSNPIDKENTPTSTPPPKAASVHSSLIPKVNNRMNEPKNSFLKENLPLSTPHPAKAAHLRSTLIPRAKKNGAALQSSSLNADLEGEETPARASTDEETIDAVVSLSSEEELCATLTSAAVQRCRTSSLDSPVTPPSKIPTTIQSNRTPTTPRISRSRTLSRPSAPTTPPKSVTLFPLAISPKTKSTLLKSTSPHPVSRIPYPTPSRSVQRPASSFITLPLRPTGNQVTSSALSPPATPPTTSSAPLKYTIPPLPSRIPYATPTRSLRCSSISSPKRPLPASPAPFPPSQNQSNRTSSPHFSSTEKQSARISPPRHMNGSSPLSIRRASVISAKPLPSLPAVRSSGSLDRTLSSFQGCQTRWRA